MSDYELPQHEMIIVALVDFEHVDQAMAELEQFEGGRILKHTLSDDVYRQLSEAV